MESAIVFWTVPWIIDATLSVLTVLYYWHPRNTWICFPRNDVL